MIELANERDAAAVAPAAPGVDPAVVEALQARLEGLEAQMIEQERTIRHTLTMLIEMVEAEEAHRAAA